jgi:hypothetical protein
MRRRNVWRTWSVPPPSRAPGVTGSPVDDLRARYAWTASEVKKKGAPFDDGVTRDLAELTDLTMEFESGSAARIAGSAIVLNQPADDAVVVRGR